jgi:CRP/FNR family transcriptional regulator, dissimilatory nitrate respiration regulator
MDILKQMHDIALFRGVQAEWLKYLADRATTRVLKTGEMVVGETDFVRAFYIVVFGQLKLYKSSPEGKEQTLYLLRPGEPFGMCTAFATESFPPNAMALEESAVLIVPGPAIETVARSEPALLLNVIQVLSNRLKESMALIESLALKEIPQRLASFLLHGLGEGGQSERSQVQLTITHRELAKILGSTPEALSRALRKMANDGLVTVDGRKIGILDRNGLEALSEGD